MSKSKLEIKREFEAFASKISRLEAMRHELDALDVKGVEQQAQHIRSRLTDVQALPQLEKDMVALKQAIVHKAASHNEHHGHSDRKLVADSKKLHEESQKMKHRIGQLQHLIEEKRKISCKKQLSVEEVSYVKDMPQLEKELASLRTEFEAHMRGPHMKVDAGVGMLVDTHFDEFIGQIKSELTARLKDKEHVMDDRLSSDLDTQKTLFAQRYKALVEETQRRYQNDVKNKLDKEVRSHFEHDLQQRLKAERIKIVEQLVHQNSKKLHQQRMHLSAQLHTSFVKKEQGLNERLHKKEQALSKNLAQRRAVLAQRVKGAEAHERIVMQREQAMKAALEHKQKAIEKQHADLERATQEHIDELKKKGDELDRTKAALIHTERANLAAKERALSQLYRNRLAEAVHAHHKVLHDTLREARVKHEKTLANWHVKEKAAQAHLAQKSQALQTELDSVAAKRDSYEHHLASLKTAKTHLTEQREKLLASLKQQHSQLEHEREALHKQIEQAQKASAASLAEMRSSMHSQLKAQLHGHEMRYHERMESLERDMHEKLTSQRHAIRVKAENLLRAKLHHQQKAFEESSKKERVLLSEQLKELAGRKEEYLSQLARHKKMLKDHADAALQRTLRTKERALEAILKERHSALSRELSRLESRRKNFEKRSLMLKKSAQKTRIVRVQALRVLQEQSARSQAEREKLHKQLATLHAEHQRTMQRTKAAMDAQLRAQTVANERAYNEKVEEMKSSMQQQLVREKHALKSKSERVIESRTRQRESSLRKQLDAEYRQKMKALLAQKEAELQKRKAMLEQHVMDHIRKMLH